jgi:capsular polysaccharide biosynthesis protein
MCPSNVEIVEVEGDRSYRLERCYFVSHLAQRGCAYLPRWYLAEFLRRVAPRRPPERTRRIYIARAGNASRRIVNEAELTARLERLGFVAYALEKLPVAQQIELFHDAEMVVAPHGAGLANLLFAENARVLELFEGPLLRPHYYFLSKACGHAYAALQTRDRRGLIGRKYDEFIESFNGSSRDFSVDCDRVVRAVEELLRKPAQSPPTA